MSNDLKIMSEATRSLYQVVELTAGELRNQSPWSEPRTPLPIAVVHAPWWRRIMSWLLVRRIRPRRHRRPDTHETWDAALKAGLVEVTVVEHRRAP
jgi:hypothetical protein